jgi:hypothetical protein
MLSQALKYLAYARECLRLAELADKSDVRYGLIELSNAWIEAALHQVKHRLKNIGSGNCKSVPGTGKVLIVLMPNKRTERTG